MALFKDFTFDGENSKDYGVYISGDAVYDAPERAMEMVQIPGRNGALALDNGYYNNIDVTYPAGCFADDQADFAAKLSRIRNMLASRHRYCRLEDAYHPDHFRMALYKSGLEVAPVARNKAGRFNITFDAKPQRFLKSGEVVQELDADAPPTTSYGPADIVSFEGEPGDVIVHGQWPLEPIQDLHGYDSPWPAGGGKNLFETTATSKTEAGVTWTVNADGSVSVSGTATGYTSFELGTNPIDTSLGTITISGISDTTNIIWGGIRLLDDNNEVVHVLTSGSSQAAFTVVLSQYPTATKISMAVKRQYDAAVSGIVKPMVELGSTATAWTPFSNICPITGFTGAEVTDRGKNWYDASTYPTTTLNGVTCTNNGDGSFTLNGAATRDTFFDIFVPQFNARTGTPLPSAKYRLTGCPSGGGRDTYTLYTTPSYASDLGSGVTNTSTITGGSIFVKDGCACNNLVFKPMIRLASQGDDTFTPFVSTTHDITWTSAGTVYGGTLAYLGGDAWRLTKTMRSVDLGTLNWNKNAMGNRNVFYNNSLTDIAGKSNESAPAICSMYTQRIGTAQSASDKQFVLKSSYAGSNSVLIYDTSYSDASVEDFKTAMSGAQLVYTISIPQVYDLTGEELQALIGTNNIFSDTGTTTITVQSPYELENPTLYPSKPLIRVYGSGTIQVNDITITVAEHSGYIDIDCDMMDCHRGADNMNQYVSFSGNDFPELQPGINRILLNGPDKVEITPRWWEL